MNVYTFTSTEIKSLMQLLSKHAVAATRSGWLDPERAVQWVMYGAFDALDTARPTGRTRRRWMLVARRCFEEAAGAQLRRVNGISYVTSMFREDQRVIAAIFMADKRRRTTHWRVTCIGSVPPHDADSSGTAVWVWG